MALLVPRYRVKTISNHILYIHSTLKSFLLALIQPLCPLTQKSIHLSCFGLSSQSILTKKKKNVKSEKTTKHTKEKEKKKGKDEIQTSGSQNKNGAAATGAVVLGFMR